MLTSIETFQVGSWWQGHTRTVYAGGGIEVWEEIRAPAHLGAYMLGRFPKDTMIAFVAELPTERPEGCSVCDMVDQLYGDGQTPQIHWEGRNALKEGWAWLSANGFVADEAVPLELAA
jgi:hypothetical protein